MGSGAVVGLGAPPLQKTDITEPYPPENRAKKVSLSLTSFVICVSTAEDINEQAGSQDEMQ